jgi:hypothetical protein
MNKTGHMKQILQKDLTNPKTIMNTARLSKGSYLIRLLENGEVTEETVLMKQ